MINAWPSVDANSARHRRRVEMDTHQISPPAIDGKAFLLRLPRLCDGRGWSFGESK